MTEAESWPVWSECFALRKAPLDDEVWRFSSWWVDRDQQYELLFGWSHPWGVGSLKWYEWAIRHHRSAVRLVVDAPFVTMRELIDGLSRGESLRSASDRAGIAPPGSRLDDASLGRIHRSRERVRGRPPDFVAAPWRLLPSRTTTDIGIASPLNDSPAMRCALVRVDKSRVLPSADAEALDVLGHLATETGLSFDPSAGRSDDIRRLGDLEVLDFAGRPDKRAPVEVVIRDGGIEVRVASELLGPGTALVRCRQTHAGAVLADALAKVSNACDGSASIVMFELCPAGASGAAIEVWTPGADAKLRLVYAHEAAWVRQVHTRMGLVQARVELGADWLDQWSSQRRATSTRRARSDAMRCVRRFVDYSELRIGHPDELWQEGEQLATKLAEGLGARASSGGWFPARDDRQNDSGKLGVAEWFRREFGSFAQRRSIVIVDPFFDTLGLDLIARSEGAQHTFAVVMALDGKPEKAAARRERLEEHAKLLQPLLGGMSLQLHIVEAKQLHDRIILELDPDGGTAPVRGFHLSNSLQSATDHHPLLVTPIPFDLLADVSDAVAAMVRGATPLALSRSPMRNRFPVAHRDAPSEAELLRAQTRTLELVDSPHFTAFCSHFSELADLLAHSPGNARDHAWALAEDASARPDLADRLEAFVMACAPREDTAMTLELAELATAARSRFDQLHDLPRLWTHGRWDEGDDFALTLALHFLFFAAPRCFVAAWTRACESIVWDPDVDVQRRHTAVLSAIMGVCQLNVVLATASADSARRMATCIELGLRSDADFVRACMCGALGHLSAPDERGQVQAPFALEAGHSLIDNLVSAEERALAIADWVTNARAAEAGREVPSLRLTPRRLLEKLVTACPARVEPDLMRRLVARCESSSPTGVWSQVLLDELLVPLVATGKLRGIDVIDLWLRELQVRVTGVLHGQRGFEATADVALTETCARLFGAQLFVRLVDDQAGRATDRLREYLVAIFDLQHAARCARDLPFARSLSRPRWKSAMHTLGWLAAFGLVIESQGDTLPWCRDLLVCCKQIKYAAHDWDDPRDPLFAWVWELLETSD